ncbi:MAG: universal stress protein [Hyphomicrobium sp.]|nr:universal stress protein [Hyphomicrobium sp.]
MYKHILIATDGSELAAKAVDAGLKLAKALNANATAVTVTEPWVAYVTPEAAIAFPFDEYEKSAAESARRTLATVDDAAKKIAVNCGTIHVKDQYPADGILDTAKSQGCDLIVMASHGRRGLGRLLLGSAAANVVTHSTVPVLICR